MKRPDGTCVLCDQVVGPGGCETCAECDAPHGQHRGPYKPRETYGWEACSLWVDPHAPKPLTEDEEALLTHVSRFGSDGYPVQRYGRSWHWEDWRSVKGPNTTYPTKREATAAFERFLETLRERRAAESCRRAYAEASDDDLQRYTRSGDPEIRRRARAEIERRARRERNLLRSRTAGEVSEVEQSGSSPGS